MSSGPVPLNSGKKLMTVAVNMYSSAITLSGVPQRPRDQRAGGRGSPKQRRQSTQPILRAYVSPRAPVRRPTIELKTRSPPRLRSAIMTHMQSEAKIEFTGRGAPSTTLIRVNQFEKGSPLIFESAGLSWPSALTFGICLPIASKRPSLARSCSHRVDCHAFFRSALFDLDKSTSSSPY